MTLLHKMSIASLVIVATTFASCTPKRAVAVKKEAVAVQRVVTLEALDARVLSLEASRAAARAAARAAKAAKVQ